MNLSVPLIIKFAAAQLGLGSLPTDAQKAVSIVPNKVDSALRDAVKALVPKPPVSKKPGLYEGKLAPEVVIPYQGKTYVLWAASEKDGTKIKVAERVGNLDTLICVLTGKSFDDAVSPNSVAHLNALGNAASSLDMLIKTNQKKDVKPQSNVLPAMRTAQTNVANAEAAVVQDILANACRALNAGCFAAGTKLWTPTGYRKVEDILAGEYVFARNEYDVNGDVEAKLVEEKFERFGRVLHLHANGQVIRTTPEHPFFEAFKGWVAADALATGDTIRTDGGWVTVEEVFDTGCYETVYNLRVAEHHTYFVGDEGWGWAAWAHNQYLGKSDPSVRSLGEGFATLASGWWNTLPSPNKLGATVAVTEVGNKKYVALYANIGNGNQQFTRAMVNQFMANATEAGWIPIFTSGNVHAEMALYSAVSNAPVIGISNPNGPCDRVCQQLFTALNYYNIVWPGTRRVSWGN